MTAARQPMTDEQLSYRNKLVEKYNRAKTRETKHKVYAELMTFEDKFL